MSPFWPAVRGATDPTGEIGRRGKCEKPLITGLALQEERKRDNPAEEGHPGAKRGQLPGVAPDVGEGQGEQCRGHRSPGGRTEQEQNPRFDIAIAFPLCEPFEKECSQQDPDRKIQDDVESVSRDDIGGTDGVGPCG